MVFKYLLRYFLSIILLDTCYSAISYEQLKTTTQPEVAVEIPQGILLGTTLTTRQGRNISAFLKIPYGQPPTGNLRFANPIAADGWNGTLNASTEASMCPQSRLNEIVGEEDCLYVKVYTPQLPQNVNSSSLAVMFYIHGGGFVADSPHYNGPEYLLDADVVLVTANYRLGPLGFLSTGDEIASGNWGLKDQVLALEWVRDNIRYFGGDPNQVTIFGESAGAGSVHLLTLSNATIGLFNKYITQSGSALAPWAHRSRAAASNRAFEFGGYFGCPNDTSDSLIKCLRACDIEDLIANSQQLVDGQSFVQTMWGPTDEPDIEGAILTDTPSNLLSAGKIRDLPWMSGVTRDEGLLYSTVYYINEEMLKNFLENIDTLLPIMLHWTNQPDSGAAWTSAAKLYYFNNDLTTNDTSGLLTNLTMLIGDNFFYYPACKALQQHHAVAMNPQYFYTFDYRGTYSFTYEATGSLVNYGVKHADDLIYLFPKDLLFSQFNETMSEADYEMVASMVQLWTSFAINGTPTASALGNGITSWEPYSAEDKYLRIGNESDVSLEVHSHFFPERMQFWHNIDAAVETDSEHSGSPISSPSLCLLLFIATVSKLLLIGISQ